MKLYKNIQLLFIFMFSFLFIEGIEAQALISPGGTSYKTELWLKSNSTTLVPFANNASITKWTDVSSNNLQFGQNASNGVPIVSFDKSKNYYPSVYFSGTPTNTKLIASTNFATDINKSYYIFAVVDNTASGTGYKTIFTFAPTYGAQGVYYNTARNAFSPFVYGRQGGRENSATGEQSSSSAVLNYILPNVYSASYPINVFYNNVKTVLTQSALFTGSTALNDKPIIGTRTATTTEPFIGSIYEIIVLSSTAGSYISETELNKVNSYLAIKYGIPLVDMANYVMSDGTTIWSSTQNAGFNNNVFGIGKDTTSGLSQKQSTGTNSSDKMTVYVGDELANLNENNTSTFFDDKDKSFILFGSTGRTETTQYIYPEDTQFANGVLVRQVNLRKSNIWKTVMTGLSSASLNIKLTGDYTDSDYLVVSSDTLFTPTNTRLYSLTEGVAQNVAVNDGDYITSISMQYAPGGVTRGLRLWLRADDYESLTFNTGSTSDISEWKDQTANGYVFRFSDLTGSTSFVRPTYSAYEEKMNFFPSVNFSLWAYLALNSTSGPYSVDSPNDMISVTAYWADVKQQSSVRLYTHGIGGTNPTTSSTRNPAVGFNPSISGGRIYMEASGSPYAYQSPDKSGFVSYSTALEMVRIHKADGVNTGSGYVQYNFGGQISYAPNVPTSSTWGSGNSGTQGATIGGASISASNTSNSGSFVGLVSDYIFYESDLTTAEVDLINTYIGIKYGITLDKDITTADSLNVNFDYILSDAATNVWKGNSAPNKNFHNNVAGIVRDDASLFVNKSKSTSSHGLIGMMSKNHTELGQGSEPDAIFTKNFSGLFWGDDNLLTKVTFNQSGDECFDFAEKTSRTWLVQKTNEDEMPVTIFMGKGGNDPYDNYVSKSYQAYLLVAKSKEDLDNKKWDLVIPGYYDSTLGYHTFDYTFKDEYTYFSLAFKALPTACETCEFTSGDTFSFSKANLGSNNLRITPATSPITKTGLLSTNGNETIDLSFVAGTGVSSMRVRPGMSRGTTRLTTSGKAQSQSTISYKFSVPAGVSFAIGGIDRNEVVRVRGVCNGDTIFPSSIYGSPLTTKNLKKKGYSYTIRDYTCYGNGKVSSGIGTATGLANFIFDFPVQELVISYTSTKATTRYLDLYPLTFSCPQPLPEPNEDGFAMQKAATSNVSVCDIVDFTFRILNANSNCEGSNVYFKDILPEGMVWLENSLTFDNDLIQGNGNVIFTADSLVIDSLHLPSNGKITTIRAQAIFKEGASTGTTYYNQSSIDYLKLDNVTAASLLSTDANYKDGDIDKRTPIVVSADERTYEYINTSSSLDKSCFRENGVITVSILVDNKNTAISAMVLDLTYNENFNYVAGSFKINGATVSDAVEMIEQDSEGDILLGSTNVSGFTLPQNPTGGKVIITYQIKAPDKNLLTYQLVDNKEVYDPMLFDYILNTDNSDDICLGNAFVNANGNGSLDYCNSRKYVISNRNVTNRIKK